MHIGPLPAVLRDIREDGRSNQEIIANLLTSNVAIFQTKIFEQSDEPIPPPGTPYNFLATVSEELPCEARSSADQVFEAITRRRRGLRKASLRSALFLMERMTREQFYADMFVLHEPVLNTESGKEEFVTLGREHGEGQSWIATVSVDHVFKFNDEIIVFLDNGTSD